MARLNCPMWQITCTNTYERTQCGVTRLNKTNVLNQSIVLCSQLLNVNINHNISQYHNINLKKQKYLEIPKQKWCKFTPRRTENCHYILCRSSRSLGLVQRDSFVTLLWKYTFPDSALCSFHGHLDSNSWHDTESQTIRQTCDDTSLTDFTSNVTSSLILRSESESVNWKLIVLVYHNEK